MYTCISVLKREKKTTLLISFFETLKVKNSKGTGKTDMNLKRKQTNYFVITKKKDGYVFAVLVKISSSKCMPFVVSQGDPHLQRYKL